MKREAICGLVLVLLFLASMLPISVSSGAAYSYGSGESPTAQSIVDWWSMLHHDPTHTGYSTSTAPNTNQTRWIYTTGGSVESSPAVANGTVFVGSNDYRVYALNASTGAQVWNYTTGNDVTSSPAVANNKVYVGGWDQKVYALNASTGAQVWNYTTGSFVFSSPTAASGKVYICAEGKVYALNASTGKQVWTYTTGGSVESSPAVASGTVFVGSDDNKTYALNALTGALVWNYTTGGMVESSPAVAGGTVYVGSYDGKVYALNASTGKRLWSFATASYVYSSPAVAAGIVYVGSYDGKVYALNAVTGAQVWNYTTGLYVHSSPAVAGGTVYVGSYDGKVYALNASTGKQVWTYTTGGSVESSPAVASGTVFVGSRDHMVYAFGPVVYTITMKANCITERADVNVQITMDGSPTGYTTPHAFAGLAGPHTFTIPNADPSGHPFKQWDTGETSTTITVASNGTETAYYRALPSVDVNGTVGISGHKLVFKETMNNSLGSQVNVGYYWSFNVDKWNGTRWIATALAGTSTLVKSYTMPALTRKDLPYYVWNSSTLAFGDWFRVRYTFHWNYSGTTYSINCVTKLHVHPGDIAGATVTWPYFGSDRKVTIEDVNPVAYNWGKSVSWTGTFDPTDQLHRASITMGTRIGILDVNPIAYNWGKTWTNTPP
jgi:outer membrane protein assembly factor BamB